MYCSLCCLFLFIKFSLLSEIKVAQTWKALGQTPVILIKSTGRVNVDSDWVHVESHCVFLRRQTSLTVQTSSNSVLYTVELLNSFEFCCICSVCTDTAQTHTAEQENVHTQTNARANLSSLTHSNAALRLQTMPKQGHGFLPLHPILLLSVDWNVNQHKL